MIEENGRVLARVTGVVQGVGYRAWVRDEAARLGLAGWVRNERDGSVTALLAGPEAVVARMVAAMRRGPTGARVTAVATEPVASGEPLDGFRIRR